MSIPFDRPILEDNDTGWISSFGPKMTKFYMTSVCEYGPICVFPPRPTCWTLWVSITNLVLILHIQAPRLHSPRKLKISIFGLLMSKFTCRVCANMALFVSSLLAHDSLYSAVWRVKLIRDYRLSGQPHHKVTHENPAVSNINQVWKIGKRPLLLKKDHMFG